MLEFRKCWAIVLFFFLCGNARGKSYSTIHYSGANGFPGAYAYSIFQDHFGYIWISTENGLARFNGYEFRLFTTKDGLPDNEVFAMHEDALQRLWYAPFANSVGYVKNDRVYNMGNSALLRQLPFSVRPEGIFTDKWGNLLFIDKEVVYQVSPAGIIKSRKLPPVDGFFCVYRTGKGEIQGIWGNDIYQFNGVEFKRFSSLRFMHNSIEHLLSRHLMAAMAMDSANLFIRTAIASGAPFYNEEYQVFKINAVKRINPALLAFSRKDGCFFVDIKTAAIIDTLMPGYNVAPVLSTTDGSLWIGTHNKGLFRFISTPVKSLWDHDTSSVSYLKAAAGGLYSISEYGVFRQSGFNATGKVVTGSSRYIGGRLSNDIYSYLGKNNRNQWISSASSISLYRTIGGRAEADICKGYGKDAYEEPEGKVLLATSNSLIRFDLNRFSVDETLINSRVTAVTKFGTEIYAGTLNGLYTGRQKGSFHRVAIDDASLSGHIVKLAADSNGKIWVANNTAEIVAVDNSKILARINDKAGFQCNRISALKASARFIWAGTDNGLYAIQNSPPYSVIRHLTYSSGLNSNQVNCLDIVGERVWVATAAGINYFDERDVLHDVTNPRLIITSIRNNNINILPAERTMKLSEKPLTINFDIIDLEGGQPPKYQYRLNDDSTWGDLPNHTLYLPEAPFGAFKVSLRVLSIGRRAGDIITLDFYKPYPVYMRGWFLVLSFLLISGIVVLLIVTIIRNVRRKDQRQLSMERNMLQLEQNALQSQMNPHFIFNSIGAIKQYYSSGNINKANEFVDIFAALIRQTFEVGTEMFVPLDKELEYLRKYLLLEQSRFNESFSFSITAAAAAAEMKVRIPAMLLQPIVENAVRHGIRHLVNRPGLISISVSLSGGSVVVFITDNGVGREMSRRFGKFYDQQRKVTSTMVNIKRIDILNRLLNGKITFQTDDVIDETGAVAGTCVSISYPLSATRPDN